MNTQPGIYVSIDELLGLQEQSRHIADNLSSMTKSMLQGNRPSKMHGRGGAFDQIRNYLAGDDVRNIDWNVTARTGKPYIRVFNEEHERPLIVLVDQSANMFFGTKKQLKSVVAAQIAAYISWMAFNHKRPCGAVIFGDDDCVAYRPKSNQLNLHGILQQVVDFNQQLKNTTQPSAENSFVTGLKRLNQIVAKDAFVLLISDFTQVNEECWQLIEKLSFRTNVIATPIYDGVVEQLPQDGQFLARYAGIEAELDFSVSRSRQHIEQNALARVEQVKHKLSQYGVPSLLFSTYQDVEQQLVSGLFINGGGHV